MSSTSARSSSTTRIAGTLNRHPPFVPGQAAPPAARCSSSQATRDQICRRDDLCSQEPRLSTGRSIDTPACARQRCRPVVPPRHTALANRTLASSTSGTGPHRPSSAREEQRQRRDRRHLLQSDGGRVTRAPHPSTARSRTAAHTPRPAQASFVLHALPLFRRGGSVGQPAWVAPHAARPVPSLVVGSRRVRRVRRVAQGRAGSRTGCPRPRIIGARQAIGLLRPRVGCLAGTGTRPILGMSGLAYCAAAYH